jgi:hypothetical protein
LARSGPAARAILKKIRRLPREQQAGALDRTLARFDIALPGRVRQVAERLHRGGMNVELAVERAVTLALADSAIGRLKSIGFAYRSGQPLPPVPTMRRRTLGDAEEDNTDEDVAKFFQGILCSNGLQSAITDTVGRNEGADARDATHVGYELAQGVAQCSTLNSTTTTTTPPVVAPAAEETSLAIPLAIGAGALLLVGGVIWFAKKKS